MQPVLIFYQLSHGQDPDWILGDCVGIALPTFLLLILGIRLVKKDGIACDSYGEISSSKVLQLSDCGRCNTCPR